MKKSLVLSLSFVLMSLMGISQNKINLIIFSEDSDPFFVFVNGVKQNNSAETNVKITSLSPNVSLRIEFVDIALPQLKQALALEPDIEHTFRIKKDTKKQVKLRYFGGVPLSEAATGIPVVAYHTASDDASTTNLGTGSQSGNKTTVTSSTITSTSVQDPIKSGGSENVSININMAGVGMNMNVTGMDATSTTGMNSLTSTTVTSYSSNSSFEEGDHTQSTKTKPAATDAKTCQYAMSQANFDKMKESIESKPFSDTKMSTAKVATKNACLSVNQIKIIAKLFSMDEDKLIYAKYAYAFCVDKANYYQVGDVFSFSTSTEELNSFLSEN